ncbi:unnamed protein product, partial [Iphiclides podalirius]
MELLSKHGVIVAEWWWVGACVGGAVLLCAAGALARPHLRRRNANAADANPPVHRHPPVLPATRLRTPRRSAAASASLNNKTRSMAGVFLPI